MSAQEVAASFIQHYYNTFDTNPEQLGGLYVSLLLPTSFHCLLLINKF
jgi:hypothetical protein